MNFHRFLRLSFLVAIFWFLINTVDTMPISIASNATISQNIKSDYLQEKNVSNQETQKSNVVDESTDWPQVQKNPQRTGYTSEVLGTNIQVAWTHPFQPEKVYPQVQAIVYEGKVFVGTEMGNLYAFDALSGTQAWKYPVGSPILNSVAAGNSKVYFGAMDGAVYGISSSSGSLIWKSPLSWRLGFSTAPVFIDNLVLIGGRNGIFYALNPETGSVTWQYDVGSPILQTAAWDNGRVYFGSMDMYLYSINTADGTLAWKSNKIPGIALKDYWPVIYQGLVYIRPMGQGGLGVSDDSKVIDPAAQQAVLNDYDANPENYTLNLLRFNEITGIMAPPIIHYNNQTMNGATSPPCVDRDGYLIMPAPLGDYSYGWGRANPSTRILIDLLYDGTNAGYGNPDENMNLTCSGNLILAMHTEESNAQYTGAFNLDTHTWIHIYYGWTSGQMSTNTQGGGGNPASISNGMIYHITYHELVARTTH
jgi:outer membrane protein assembly factor BamB